MTLGQLPWNIDCDLFTKKIVQKKPQKINLSRNF